MNVLNRLEHSRRDDLESLGLVIINLYKGVLPWSNLEAEDIHERLEKIKYLRLITSNEKLCKNLPKEFCEYMNYVQYLNFDDNPDYTYLKSLFLNVLKKIGEKNDLFFSWVPKKIKNNKSFPNILKKIFSPNSTKMKSPENKNVSTTNILDNKLLNHHKNKTDICYFKENQNNIHFIDNKINIINSNNNKYNKNEINDDKNMIYFNNKDNKKDNISKKIKTSNLTEKNNTYLDIKKLNRVELNRDIEMLDLKKYKNNKVPDKDKIKNRNVINLDITNNNYFTEFNNKNLISNKFDTNKLNKKNDNNEIPSSININNINKLQINNNTYVTIFKKNNSPKLKNYSHNKINSANINEIKEYKIKNLYTNKISPNILSRNSSNLYQSNFIHNSNVNKDISIISKKLIKENKSYIKQIRKVNITKKLKSQNFPKFHKINCGNKTRNLKANYSYSQTNLYSNQYFYKENAITFNNSPNKI